MNIIIQALLTSIISFFIGSIPTAYLLIKKQSGKDLRSEGSGNIGALNAFEVSNSKRIGAMVLGIDLIKGVIPIVAVHFILGDNFLCASLAMNFTILGHNYSPWIGFKGGRGLASAAGASLFYNPFLLLLWGILWLVSFFPSRNVHIGNIVATLLTPVAAFTMPAITRYTTFFTFGEFGEFMLASGVLFLLLLLKHAGPMKDLFTAKKS